MIWGDTSGSRSDSDIASSIAEIAGIIADTQPKRLTVLWGDADIANVEEIDDASDLTKLDPRGGGGTDIEPALEWIEQNCEEPPDMFMPFTDGYLTFPDEEPRYPVMWVMSTDVKPPWGTGSARQQESKPVIGLGSPIHNAGNGGMGQATSKSSGGYGQTDRFRSFAERYIIERASSFIKGKELEEGWQAAQDAKKLYQIIADIAQVDQSPSEITSPTPQAQPNALTAMQQAKLKAFQHLKGGP